MVANIYDPDKRKLLSSLSHGSIFLSALVLSIGIPLVILLVSDDPVIKENAREAINFHVNVWFYGILFNILCWVIIGFPLLGLLFLVHWIMPALAIRHSFLNPDEPYNYPLIFHVL
ncbi:DUF4870 domain-containing protein [Acaryochloris sp. IP29b_bin.137]|uniref:DUF4870 domain-containing protein n=1 Tax=Acaryochloris sp. IP29b_bin.137 TaxID=2969217 RepID=UPI00260215D0|nr:DUF4870 domain-containing protein [Acaryochloris sp. IP29b_bin.137]